MIFDIIFPNYVWFNLFKFLIILIAKFYNLLFRNKIIDIRNYLRYSFLKILIKNKFPHKNFSKMSYRRRKFDRKYQHEGFSCLFTYPYFF